MPMSKDAKIALSQETNAEEVVLQLYDLGVQSCKNGDKETASRVLRELISALDFSYPELANSFYQLYVFVLKMVAEDKFESALEILNEMRDIWDKLVLTPQGPGEI